MTERTTNPKDALAHGKAAVETVPLSLVLYAAMQLHNGGGKYGLNNYRATGVRASVYYGGMLRHLVDWFNGNDNDEEGIPNLAGMAANLAILCDAAAHGYLVDDRPPRVNMRALIQACEREVAKNNARNAGKNPRHYTIADQTYEVAVPVGDAEWAEAERELAEAERELAAAEPVSAEDREAVTRLQRGAFRRGPTALQVRKLREEAAARGQTVVAEPVYRHELAAGARADGP